MSQDGCLKVLSERLAAFAAERDWEKFHSPKNLSIALAVEAAEIMQHFQWLTEAESRSLPEAKRKEVALELADVLNYLVRLADQLGVDLLKTADEKIIENATKYPAEKSRGSAKKYTEL